MPNGTFTPNAQRQEKSAVSHPPSRGPDCGHPPDDGAPDCEGYRAVLAAEGGVDDRECRRQHHGPADALDDARQDQGVAGRRDPRQDRREREHRDTDDEEPSTPDPIGHGAEQHEQRGEDERVRLLHPLHLRGGDLQFIDDGGDCDVDDRRIHDDQ
jgi:hypothetical protein